MLTHMFLSVSEAIKRTDFDKVAEIINEKGLDSSKTTGWFSWLFG